MGTQWHIALYADDEESANLAFQQAWREIREINQSLSNYLHDSELNQLCRSSPHSDFVSMSVHLGAVLRAASKMSRESDGYFDVTIAPVSNLWRRARVKRKMPAASRLEKAAKSVGYRFVEFGADNSVRLTKADMKIDLGGIAKGYAVDRAMQKLRDNGIRAALVNGGGDLAAFGSTPNEDGWLVKISGVRKDDPRQQLLLKNAAIATSGDAWQFVEINGKRYSHLIDPKSGLGSTRSLAVSVFAPTCMQADSLASAVCIMPEREGLKLLERKDSVAARIVELDENDKPKTTTTEGFPATPL